jgi:hypothetical protein
MMPTILKVMDDFDCKGANLGLVMFVLYGMYMGVHGN